MLDSLTGIFGMIFKIKMGISWNIKSIHMMLYDQLQTSGQDGGVGRHVSPPCATTKRITTQSQNNTQNCQKTEPYGSLATKDLKKPHSSRWVGGAEMQ